nr:type II toxin-antitoxin system RelE/ParE family toxin [Neorhizobium tomejilense]
MKVVITDEALSDISSITKFIRKDNPPRAISFALELREASRQLGNSPGAFAALSDYPESGIRRRPYGNYVILYRIGGATVEILHIFHGAQDYESVLFPKE